MMYGWIAESGPNKTGNCNCIYSSQTSAQTFMWLLLLLLVLLLSIKTVYVCVHMSGFSGMFSILICYNNFEFNTCILIKFRNCNTFYVFLLVDTEIVYWLFVSKAFYYKVPFNRLKR